MYALGKKNGGHSKLMVIIGGDRFTDPKQQEVLTQVLVRTDALHGWPTHALQRQLRETWEVQ